MSIPDVIADLRPLLSAWRIDAIGYIRNNLQRLVTVTSDGTWIHAEGDRYEESSPSLVLKQESSEQLKELGSYLEVDRAAQASDVLRPMMGQLVGTSRSASQFSTWTLANAFLPRIVDLLIERVPSFDRCYETVNRQLVERKIEYQAICPIQGIGFEVDGLWLIPGLSIERLSPDEICLVLQSGAMPTMFPYRFNVHDSNSFALKKSIRVPVTVNGSSQGETTIGDVAASQQFIQLLRTSEDVISMRQCLSLMTDRRVQVSGILIGAKGGGFLGTDTGTQHQVISATWMPDSQLGFDLPMCVELQRIWGIAHGDPLSRDKALGLAWRRLAFATQRTVPEDRLLDVFIAAEAFYRTDADGARTRSRSIGAPLAERVAEFSDQTLPGWSEAEVLTQMKIGYKVRNAVVHGREPEAKYLVVKGRQTSLNEVVQVTEAIVRAGLRKAIRKLSESYG